MFCWPPSRRMKRGRSVASSRSSLAWPPASARPMPCWRLPRAPGRRRRCRGRLRRDAWPRRNRSPAGRAGDHAAPQGGLSRRAVGRDGPRRGAGAATRTRAGRRAGAHQRAGLAPSQALPGCDRTARGGHRRLHHRQRPALREPRRRCAPDHRHHRAREQCPTRCSIWPTRSS